MWFPWGCLVDVWSCQKSSRLDNYGLPYMTKVSPTCKVPNNSRLTIGSREGGHIQGNDEGHYSHLKKGKIDSTSSIFTIKEYMYLWFNLVVNSTLQVAVVGKVDGEGSIMDCHGGNCIHHHNWHWHCHSSPILLPFFYHFSNSFSYLQCECNHGQSSLRGSRIGRTLWEWRRWCPISRCELLERCRAMSLWVNQCAKDHVEDLKVVSKTKVEESKGGPHA